MSKAVFLTEFQASKEQFALTMEAEWRHATYSDAPEQHWRFVKPSPSRSLYMSFEIDGPEPVPVVECWREGLTIPELAGNQVLSCLHVKDGADEWLFANDLFFRIELVEVSDELP